MSSYTEYTQIDRDNLTNIFGVSIKNNVTGEIAVKKTAYQPTIAYIQTVDRKSKHTFDNGVFRIYYVVPDYGMQYFDFSGDDFIFAYNNSKFKRQFGGDDDDWAPFDKIFSGLGYKRFNNVVRSIFKFYTINPSLLDKVLHKRKGGGSKVGGRYGSSGGGAKNKITLSLKKRNVLAAFGIIVDKKVLSAEERKEKIFSSLSQDDIDRCIFNMNVAVSKAAKSYDLNFFDFYLSAFAELNGIRIVSKLKEKKLFEKFQKEVDNFRKMC